MTRGVGCFAVFRGVQMGGCLFFDFMVVGCWLLDVKLEIQTSSKFEVHHGCTAVLSYYPCVT